MAELIKFETGHGPGSWIPRPQDSATFSVR